MRGVKSRRMLVFIASILVVLAAIACSADGRTATLEGAQASRPQEGPATVIAVSQSVAAFDEIRYVRDSSLIVLGTVTELLPSTWEDNRERIFTPARVAVEKAIKGPPPGKEVLVYQLGGTVDNVAWLSSESVKLAAGKRYLFFLAPIPRQKSEKLMPVGSYVGAVPVEGDSVLPNRGQAVPTKPEPLGQLIANVETAMRGDFHPTPTPTLGPVPTQFPSGGLYPPKPPQPVKPGE